MNNNVIILVDANFGIVGSYAGMHSDKGHTQDFVYIEYFPFNGFFGKPCRYPMPVKKDHIHFVPMISNGMKGIPPQMVFIYNPEDDKGLSKFLKTADAKRISDLMSRNQELANQKATLQQELLAAKSGATQQLAEVNTPQEGDRQFGFNPLNRFGLNNYNDGGE